MKIAVDMDEIIAGFLDAFIIYQNETHNTAFKKSDFFSYEFWRVTGDAKEEDIKKVYNFIDSPYFDNIEPITGAIEALKRIKDQQHSLYIITSRPDDFSHKTKIWLEKYLPNIFEKVIHSNAYFKNKKARKKSEICDELGVDIMIEDNLDYAIECLKPNRKIILFKYPWNEEREHPKEINTVAGWDEALEIIINT